MLVTFPVLPISENAVCSSDQSYFDEVLPSSIHTPLFILLGYETPFHNVGDESALPMLHLRKAVASVVEPEVNSTSSWTLSLIHI